MTQDLGAAAEAPPVSSPPVSPLPVSPEAARALAALLAIDSATAALVRERTPSRRRVTPQYGPQLDLGD